MKKNPLTYPIQETQQIKDPYKTLGVKNTDTLDTIHKVYKKYITALHPDKALTTEAKKLGWTVESKFEAFTEVKDAYEKILILRKESKCPDYNIDYYIDEELKTRLSTTFKQEDTRPENYNKDKFNKNFEIEKKKHEENGFIDPFAKGYEGFGRTSEEDAKAILRGSGRAEVPIPKQYNLEKPKLTEEGRLVVAVPKETQAFGLPTHNIPFSELGLTTVTNFSIKSTCKGGLCGTDLVSAYSNNEYWEDSVKRDPDLYKKYTDTTDPAKLISKRTEKVDFDPIIQQQINAEKEKEEKMEELRRTYLKQQDLYYDRVSTGRIAYKQR